jgi:hypothetical protein
MKSILIGLVDIVIATIAMISTAIVTVIAIPIVIIGFVFKAVFK